MTNWAIRSRLPSWLIFCGHKVKLTLVGFTQYLVFMTGRVPLHWFRSLVYRRIFGVTMGRHSALHWRARFYAPGGVSIGDHSVIGNDAFLDGRFGIVIGNNVNIGGEVAIFTAEHDPNSIDFAMVGDQVRICDYVYVGTRVTILPGVTIGQGAVVATGAVVTKDVKPFTIVGGIPARHIGDRRRDLEYVLDFRLPFQ